MKSLQDEARRAEYNDALALLAAVAKGEFAIQQPSEPIESDTGAVSPSISAKRLKFTRLDQDGA